MKRNWKIIGILCLLGMLLSSCNFPVGNAPSEDDIATSVAQTVAAIDVQNQPTPTIVILPTNTLPPVVPTATPQPTNTSAPVIPTSTPKPCNQAWLVSESPLDNEVFDDGETFTKTWNLKNIGTCTWNTSYKAVFISGSSMGGPASKPIGTSIAPGETLRLSLSLTAPTTPGTYKGVWNLQDDTGKNFANFWVQIKVKGEEFAVTSVHLSAENTELFGICPQTFHYRADITTSAAGTVTYYWVFSDGTTSATKSIVFDSADTETVTGTWELNIPGNHWIKIYIDNPNHQMLGH